VDVSSFGMSWTINAAFLCLKLSDSFEDIH
jgi:hypothetical protein